MEIIDNLLEFLASNPRSFDIAMIAKSTKISKDVCGNLVRFLASYGFLWLDSDQAKMDSRFRKFVVETAQDSLLEAQPLIADLKRI